MLKGQIISKVRKELDIDSSLKIALYAPTYRENFAKELYGLDISSTLSSLEKNLVVNGCC